MLHELLHVIGFWHEHSRADRDKYVQIIWSVILKDAWRNFCKHETTNMLSSYDFGSLLHYSSVAFSADGSTSIKALTGDAKNMGQRIKLSNSDILRVNKLYHCPQYVPPADENEDFKEVIDNTLLPTICSEANLNDPLSLSAATANSLKASSLSLTKELSPVSPPTEESKTSEVALNSSSLESKPGSATTSFFSQESRLVPTSLLYSSTREPTDSITGSTVPNGGATLESLKRTAGHESIQDNSTVLIPLRATEQLQNGSFVTNSESNMVTGHKWGIPLEVNTTAFLKSSFTGEENGTEHSTVGTASFGSNSSESTMTASTIRDGLLTDPIQPTSIFMTKSTLANIDIMEESTTSARLQSSAMQQTSTEDPFASSGSGEVPHEDPKCVKESNHLNIVRKRSLVGKTFGSWSEHNPRLIHGNKLILSYNNRRKKSSEMNPFCGFEHGFCGWKQSTEDDLDWKLSWRSLNVNAGYVRPKGFHLSLKSSPEKAVSEQKALLLRPIVQPSNCISFWYGSRHSNMGTLNVYIASSGKEHTLLWSSDGQDHVKSTKAQIMLPPHLLSNNAQVIVEGVVQPSDTSRIAIDDLYVGQCS